MTIRVMLIDDDATYQSLTEKMLARAQEDFALDWVGGYKAGLESLLRAEHDIYLVDYHLGKDSGIDLVREAVKKGVTVPIIMMTGQGEPDIDIQAIKAGATDYIDKADMKPASLARSIHYALERSRTMVQLRVSEERYKTLLDERENYIQQLMILRQVDDELSQVLNVDYVLSLSLDAAMRLSGADTGYIGLNENGQIEMAQAIGQYAQMPQGSVIKPTVLMQRAIDNLEATLVQDVSREPDYTPQHAETRAQMILPMMQFERLIGVLTLETHLPERFTTETFDFIKLISARAAVAVENARLHRNVQEQLAELQTLYERVSSLEQIKTDMIRIAAHDLRNPVSVIVGYIELLQWDLSADMNDKRKRFLESIERAARRMEKITTDILSLERIENIQDAKTEDIMLNQLIQETFKEYVPQAEEKDQDYRLNIQPETLTVMGDIAQIREATANLISNAIKYTPNTGRVIISLFQEGNEAVFRVDDTGYGIPEEQQSNLFKPFFRAQSQETASIDGTGLGLHLVKNVIERFGGKMVFASTYGKGSTFGFRVPLVTPST